MIGEAMPTGRERPGEHWNARIIREEADAARAARAEANHPARLLGVAQVAIETALRLTDPVEIHAHLTEALARIKPTEVPA